MDSHLVDPIATAVLYEGYILYPYRLSMKNRQRWTFGGIYPEAFIEAQQNGDACFMQTECLIQGSPGTRLEVEVRFLHGLLRQIEAVDVRHEPAAQARDPLLALRARGVIDGHVWQSWQEASERRVPCGSRHLGDLVRGPCVVDLSFPADEQREPLRDRHGAVQGMVLRQQLAIAGTVDLAAHDLGGGLFRVTVRIANRTPMIGAGQTDRQTASLLALQSTHAILQATDGEFVSLIDPPEPLRAEAARCRNIGAFPVLVGDPRERNTMLSSPIILYDYPQVAPESPGDFFDGTEIDEMLTLRILTMTDAEKQAMAGLDERSRSLLERTEAQVADQSLRLHGTMREAGPEPAGQPWDCENPFGEQRTPLEEITIDGKRLHRGSRVRLSPPSGRQTMTDLLDLALAGKAATIDCIEQDFEGRVFLAVTVDDDPGRDLGAQRKIAHRFYFRPEEVELIED